MHTACRRERRDRACRRRGGAGESRDDERTPQHRRPSMDAATFRERAEQDPNLGAFLREVAEEAERALPAESSDDPGERPLTVTGLEVLLAVAAYGLFRW